jgi:hypothetical protein
MMMRVVVWLMLFCLTPVWAISYTVQVVASSDETRANQVRSELADQGYPAYLLNVPTAQGQVYRIRVGAFANRAAAALFAEAMPSIEGSTPSPALAEGGVPPGLIPFEPALIGRYDLTTTLVQVFPWPVSESRAPGQTREATQQDSSTGEASPAATLVAPEAQVPSSSDTQQGDGPPEDSLGQATFETTPLGTTSAETTTEDTTTEDTITTQSSTESVATETDMPELSNQSSSGEVTPLAQTAQVEPAERTATQPIMVIRIQPRDLGEQAHYRIGDLEFDAWNAAPLENGEIVRVRSLSVWPGAWQSITEAERKQYRETVLANVAGDLDLTPQQLEPFVFEIDNKAPFVVLVERFNPETQQAIRLRAIGQPRPNEENLGLHREGPSSFFGESTEIPTPEANTVFEPSSSSQVPDELEGNGWLARSDGDYVTLSVGDKKWRAANGKPVWASGDLLISVYNNEALIYQLEKP